jgi:hypothetical protein
MASAFWAAGGDVTTKAPKIGRQADCFRFQSACGKECLQARHGLLTSRFGGSPLTARVAIWQRGHLSTTILFDGSRGMT